MTDLKRIEMPIVGKLSNALKGLDRKSKSKETDFKKNTRTEWQRRDDFVDTSVLEKMKQLGKRKIDDSFIGTRIEYLSEFYLVGEGNMRELSWCGGFVKKIIYGTWVKPGKLHK